MRVSKQIREKKAVEKKKKKKENNNVVVALPWPSKPNIHETDTKKTHSNKTRRLPEQKRFRVWINI